MLKTPFILLAFVFVLGSMTSCDRARNCECTTVFSGNNPDNLADVVNTYEFLDRTWNPDCTPYETVVTEPSGLIRSTTCVKVRD